jgi:recombination DNA repair RAD52 pathway protein
MLSPEQNGKLAEKLSTDKVKTRNQAGRSVSYIEAWQARAECNEVFGFEGWDSETLELRLVSERDVMIGKNEAQNKPGYPGHGVSYVCKVRVTVRAGDCLVVRDGVGAGHGIDRDLGQAHESAVKEAESDAFKRAVINFGWRFGLALYDKEQEHVEAPMSDADRLIEQIAGMTTEAALQEWGKTQAAAMKALPGADYNRVRNRFGVRLASLKPLQAANV